MSELLIPKEVENNIKAIYIPRNLNPVDTLTWSLTPHVFFSTSSAYKHATDNHSMTIHNTKDNHSMIIQNTKDYNWIWSLNCPNKIKYFMWLCNHNRLPTCHYLNSVGINIEPLCVMCSRPETITHIFLHCNNVHQ